MKQKREQQKQKRWIFGLSALGIFGLCTVLAIVGMANSVGQIREVEVAQSPTALLASAGVDENKTIALPVTYFDQVSDVCIDLYDSKSKEDVAVRQWEWTNCGYKSKKLETGMASENLNEQGVPELTAGETLSNKGVDSIGWFETVEGISQEAGGTLQLQYQQDGAIFSFAADDFYPLDDVKFSDGDTVNADGHNRLFTMMFAVPFQALLSGEESFSITADDDTFVYLDGQLVLDMGGIHGPVTGELVIDTDGRAYRSVNGSEWEPTGVKLAQGASTDIAVFHADRDSNESVFDIQFAGMDLMLNEGTQIAAVTGNANDPTTGYEAPLGESKVFQPDQTRPLVLMATIEGVLVVAAAMLTVIVAKFVVKQKYNS